MVAVGVAYGLVAQLTLIIEDPVGQGAAFFPAAGITVAALLLLDRRMWGWALAGVWLAELSGDAAHGYDTAASMWWATANTVEPLVGASLISAFVQSDRYLVPVRHTITFLLAGAVVAPAVGGAIGAVGTTMVSSHAYGMIALKWAVGDALGVLVVAPLLLSWRERGSDRSLLEQGVLAVSLVIIPLAVFRSWQVGWEVSAPLLTVPLLTWTALRHGVKVTTWAIALTTCTAHWATVHGYGPFAFDGAGPTAAATAFQVYLGIVAATTLIVAALAEDLVDRGQFEGALRHAALHDPLTGLPNRLYLDTHLSTVRESQVPTALLACDIDNFKLVNDALGHHAGDEFLVKVVERMRSCLPPDGLLVRQSGDEFIVVLPDASEGQAQEVATKIGVAVSAPLRLGSQSEIRPSVSIGIASSDPDDDPLRALQDADAALYKAKARGRGRVHEFDEVLRSQVSERVSMETDISAALDRDISCVFQPCFDLRSGAPRVIEALARWNHPDRGLIDPERFVPVAESTGNAAHLFSVVLRQALDCWAAWAADLPQPLPVAVNLSVVQLADKGLADFVEAELDRVGAPASALWVEVTETGLTDLPAAETLHALHERGVSLAIDDFGTGWSSMARLAELPWDAIKIDRSFVAGLGTANGADQVVEATIGLAHALGLTAIAEGVETDEQLSSLREMGCDVAQGFLLGRPAPPEDLVLDASWIVA